MTDGQPSSDASPLATRGTQSHSRLINHVARTSSSVRGDPSSGFTFGKAQPVRGDLVGKFKTTMPLGNAQDPNSASAQPHLGSGSTGLELAMPPVAQGRKPISFNVPAMLTSSKGKPNHSPMFVPFPLADNQNNSVHAEPSIHHASVTTRPPSRRAQDTTATPSRLNPSQRAKADGLEISTSLSNGVLDVSDPNACKLPALQQGISPHNGEAPAVKGTPNDQKDRVNKRRRHQSSSLRVDNRPTYYDTQIQMKIFEALHEYQNGYCLLAQRCKEQGSLLEDIGSDIKAKEATIQAQNSEITQFDDSLRELTQMYVNQSERLTRKEAALARFEQKKPEWEAKVKKLTEALNGLCNDHNRLRDTGKKLLTRTNLIDADESIREALSAIQASNEADRAKAKDIASKYHKHIEDLEKRLLALQSQKTNSPKDAEAEREKSARLEAELTKITNSHEKMRQEYAKSYLEVCSKA